MGHDARLLRRQPRRRLEWRTRQAQWLLRALVRDYTRKGDLVADYFAGWSTTLLAALGNGRRAIGAEMDRAAYDESCRRLRGGVQLDMLAGVA